MKIPDAVLDAMRTLRYRWADCETLGPSAVDFGRGVREPTSDRHWPRSVAARNIITAGTGG